MTVNVRRQLSLFLPIDSSGTVEKVRKEFNPIQFGIIKAHITLCRDDEIENLDRVLLNLASLQEKSITIQFDELIRFDNGKGLYLKSDDKVEYSRLRQRILKTIISEPRMQIPHITLMHPRNSTCTDEIFEQISKETFPLSFTFNEISLIEQRNGGEWKLLKTFYLTQEIFDALS